MEEQRQHRFTGKIKTDRAYLTEIFSDCSDMKMKDMKIGKDKEISCFLIYIEITMSSVMFRTTAIGNFLVRLSDMDAGDKGVCGGKRSGYHCSALCHSAGGIHRNCDL